MKASRVKVSLCLSCLGTFAFVYMLRGFARPAARNLSAQETREFLLISQPRSGTTFLSQAFGAHPCMKHIGEEGGAVLNMDIDYGRGDYFYKALSSSPAASGEGDSVECPVFYYGGKRFLAEVFNDNPGTSTKQGIRLQSDHEIHKFGQFLSRYPKIRLIFMLRRNLVDYYITRGTNLYKTNSMTLHCRARKCNDHISRKVTADLGQMGKFIRDHHKLQAQALAAFQRIAHEHNALVLYVPYERVAEDDAGTLARVLEFLELPHSPERVRGLLKVRKMLRQPRDQLLTNWGAVRAALLRRGGGGTTAAPPCGAAPGARAECEGYVRTGLAGLAARQRQMAVLPDPGVE